MVALADFGGAEDIDTSADACGFIDQDAFRDDLAEIFVRADEIGTPPDLFSTFGEGPHKVVGFIAIEFEDGDTKGFCEAQNVGEGCAQFLGHGLSSGFVVGVEGVAMCGRWGVEDGSDVGGLLPFKNVEKGVGVDVGSGGVVPG